MKLAPMVLVVLLASALPASAIADHRGTIAGLVKNADDGRPIPGVTVLAQGPGSEHVAVTNVRGAYVITPVPPGTYRVAFFVPGRRDPMLTQQAQVVDGTAVRANALFSLRELDVKKSEQVVRVTEKAPSIDIGTTKRGTKFDKEYMAKVPQRGRDFESLLENAPGASGDDNGVSLGGAQSVESSYVIEGIDLRPPPPATGDLVAASLSAPAHTPPPFPAAPTPERAQDPQATARLDRLLVYTAGVTLSVFEVGKTLADIDHLARRLGGYMSSRDDASITIRVPAGQFDEAMRRLAAIGDVLAQKVVVEDVSDDFFDAQTRLRNARAVRDRLEKLLLRAMTVEDALAVQCQLGKVTEEIEKLEGKLKLMRERVAFATLAVTCSQRSLEKLDQAPYELPFAWLERLGLARLGAVR